MKSYKDFLKEELKDDEFKREYNDLNSTYEVINALIIARKNTKLTQKELSELSGVAQSDISKLENGNSNPTIKLLGRLAQAMNMRLKIEFVK